MNNRTKGCARQPVPDSHSEKVGTPLQVEFSCFRYEKLLSQTTFYIFMSMVAQQAFC